MDRTELVVDYKGIAPGIECNTDTASVPVAVL